jgi:hypothetical protein
MPRIRYADSPANESLKLSECFGECLKTPLGEKPFTAFYQRLAGYFGAKGQFMQLEADHAKDLPWPSNPGVYVVRRKGRGAGADRGEIAYIGMTGTYGADGNCSPTQGLRHRRVRSHPYCFTQTGPFKDHFEFAPNFGVNEITKKPPVDRYRDRIAMADLRVDCFFFSRAGKSAPAALESVLLQFYLEEFHRLPIANNKF